MEVEQKKKIKKLAAEREKKMKKKQLKSGSTINKIKQESSSSSSCSSSSIVINQNHRSDEEDEFYDRYTKPDMSSKIRRGLNDAMGVSAAISAANIATGVSLCLEFIQLATFPFQSDQQAGGGDDGGGSGSVDDGGSDNSSGPPKWLSKMYGVSYGVDFSAFDIEDCKYLLNGILVGIFSICSLQKFMNIYICLQLFDNS
jgi:hypothetical protein